MSARTFGADGGIPRLVCWNSNLSFVRMGTEPGGQFDWGGCLPKSNGGVQRSPQAGWESVVECKGIRWLDCETYKSSREETRA